MALMDEAFGNWLAGFADGEGCFTIDVRNRWTNYSCSFTLGLRLDDAAIIREIVDRTGLGRVSVMPARAIGAPKIQWRVRTKGDCRDLVALFEQYPLRAKKARDFAIWREAVRLWLGMFNASGTSRHVNNWASMGVLRDALMAMRVYEDIVHTLPTPQLELLDGIS